MLRIFNIMLSRGLGGMEQAFCDYACLLSDQKVFNICHPNAKVLSFPKHSPLQKDSSYIWTNITYSSRLLTPFSLLKTYLLLKKYCPHVVIAHGRRPIRLFYSLCRHLKIPLVVVHHDYYKKSFKGDAHIAVTKSVLKFIKENSKDKLITHIPNVIMGEYADHALKNQEAREQSSQITIGSLGRLSPEKGLDVLLNAVAVLSKNKLLSFKVLLAGDGPLFNDLKKMAAQAQVDHLVDMPGWIDKRDFFQAIDIFCLPSRHETFGLVLLEAMLFKKPIVTSSTQGPCEIMTPDKDALFFKVNDPNHLASCLTLMLENINLRQRLSEAAFQKFNDTYLSYHTKAPLFSFLEKTVNSYSKTSML